MVKGREFHLVFISKHTNIPWFWKQQQRGGFSAGHLASGNPSKLAKKANLIDGAFSFAACNAFTEDEPQW